MAQASEADNCRTLSDIMLDGGGYHQGYLNYNSDRAACSKDNLQVQRRYLPLLLQRSVRGAKETPARIARRLSQQKPVSQMQRRS